MLPSRGFCHGVFLLGHAARQKERYSLEEWIESANERSTFMSKALRLEDIAKELLKIGLATTKGRICLDNSFTGLFEKADKSTLLAIARLVFLAKPPNWLRLVVHNGQIVREYIPTEDLEGLAWVEPGLDQMLLDGYGIFAAQDDGFLKAMGDAAELFVLAALRRKGENPLHVSKISDAYGYDIECLGKTIHRIEVKASSQSTQSTFYISRNEFEKSGRYGQEWRLVQVVFSSKAFVATRLDSSHVDCLRELKRGALQELVPADTQTFKWTGSAKISTVSEFWSPPGFELDPDFSIPGFGSEAPSAI